MTYYDMTETIYFNGMIINFAYSNAPIEVAHNVEINLQTRTGSNYILRPTGVVEAIGGGD